MTLESNENEHNASSTGQREADDTRGESTPQVPPAPPPPMPPQPLPTPESSNKNPSTWRDNYKLAIEICGLVILIAYTVFSCLQWLQIRWTNRLTTQALMGSDKALSQTLDRMQAQVNATDKLGLYAKAQAESALASVTLAREQFRKEQRPYLAETTKSTESPSIFPNPNTPGLVQIIWNWHMTNYGKSPAKQIVMNQEMSTDGMTFIPSYGGSGKAGGKAHDFGGSEPPGYDSFNTIFSAPMQAEEANRILNSSSGVSIRIRITYQDLSGTPYETAICLISKNIGAVSYCKDSYIH